MRKAIFYTMVGLLLHSAVHAATDEIPRTRHGRPDFDGSWYYGSATPLERSVELGKQRDYSDAEAEALVRQLINKDTERLAPSIPEHEPPAGATIGQEADANFITTRTNLTRIDGAYRTSLIVDPPDGRLPYRRNGQDIFDRWRAEGVGEFDGPEVRPASERCLSPVGPIAPMVGWVYNANMRIVQTDDHVVINGEMLAPRIIPLAPSAQRLGFPHWSGESTARWEGDVLVIHTTNFRPEVSWFRVKVSDQMELTESFELVSPDEMVYRYTLVDPEIYTAPHTVEMSISRRPPGERLFEFACHEGNYSLPGILRGARLQERVQEAATAQNANTPPRATRLASN